MNFYLFIYLCSLILYVAIRLAIITTRFRFPHFFLCGIIRLDLPKKEFALNNKSFLEICLNNQNLMKIWHQTLKNQVKCDEIGLIFLYFWGIVFHHISIQILLLGASFISLTYCHLILLFWGGCL
jgi:hypothetical protein